MGSDSPTPAKPVWLSQPPSAFDVVAAYFPETKPKDELRPRPCLVLDVLKGKESGSIACRVAYGTKNLKFTQRKHLDLIIQNAADLRLVGLPTATRFVLDGKDIVVLPWTEQFFACWKGYKHPKIGRLTEDYVRDYAYLMTIRKSNDML